MRVLIRTKSELENTLKYPRRITRVFSLSLSLPVFSSICMRFLLVLCFFQIEFLSCIFENQTEQEDFLEQINRERKHLGLADLQIHLTLQLAARKRCANREELMQTYENILARTYRNDQWPRQELLDRIFPRVSESIDFHRLENVDRSSIIPNFYRNDWIYVGIGENEQKNFSVRCILYGSSNNLPSNHRRLLRLLYILLACGIFLLSLIICSILNDRRQARLKQELEQQMLENTQANMISTSHRSLIDRRSLPSVRRTEVNRMTLSRLGSTLDGRSSAVHSFFQSPK